MSGSPEPRAVLPRVFVATDGRERLPAPRGPVTGILLRDTDLATLVTVAESGRPLLAVDLDSIEGMNADIAAARFVTGRLGFEIVATRRPALARWIADQGTIALLHVLSFDSTGLGRSLETHPRAGVGTLISPGPVLAHLAPADLAALAPPVVAYGLIESPDAARRLLEIADSVVVSPECATAILGVGEAFTSSAGQSASSNPDAEGPRRRAEAHGVAG